MWNSTMFFHMYVCWRTCVFVCLFVAVSRLLPHAWRGFYMLKRYNLRRVAPRRLCDCQRDEAQNREMPKSRSQECTINIYLASPGRKRIAAAIQTAFVMATYDTDTAHMWKNEPCVFRGKWTRYAGGMCAVRTRCRAFDLTVPGIGRFYSLEWHTMCCVIAFN